MSYRPQDRQEDELGDFWHKTASVKIFNDAAGVDAPLHQDKVSIDGLTWDILAINPDSPISFDIEVERKERINTGRRR